MLPGAEQRRGSRRGGGLRRPASTAAAFALYSLRRFNADGCFAASGALSYTALVSLVPLAAIALGSLSVFPIFGQLHDQILGLVFKYFVPSIGEQAGWWFRAFANSAAQTTAIGVIGIAATGVLLLVTVEDQLNLIWRVTAPRPWGQRVLAYWTLITLGPLLIGLSLSLSTYFEIAARRAGFRPASLSVAGERLAARAGARGAGAARIRRADLALLADPELRGSLARRGTRGADRDGGDRDPEDRVHDLYRRDVLLPDRLRGARGDPDLSVVDVHFVDGGAARRRGRRGRAALADRRAHRDDLFRRGAARAEPGADRGPGAGATVGRDPGDAVARGRARGCDDGHRRAHEAARRGRVCRPYPGGKLGVGVEPRERHPARPLRGVAPCRLPAAGSAMFRRRGSGRSRRRSSGSSGPKPGRCR